MHWNVRTAIGALALGGMAVLGVAACGSDKGSGSSGSSGGSNGTASAAGSGSDSSDLCSYAQELEQSLNPDSLAAPDKATFDKLTEALSTAQEKAPAELKGDLGILADSVKSVRDFFAEYDFDLGKLTSAVQADPSLATKQLQAVDSAEVQAAGKRVDTYLQEQCGIEAGS
jgi:hypothetical protein